MLTKFKPEKIGIGNRLLRSIIIITFLYSCNTSTQKNEQGNTVIKTVEEPKEDTVIFFKKYQIKSGTITYETVLNTISVHLKFKKVVYFDNYGMKERRDTYTGDTLDESLMSDGKNMYNIMHKTKEAFKTGQAYHGTESKFGWDEISQEDKALGKAKKYPDEIIAGKKCEVYHVEIYPVLAIYAGWKNICLFTEIKSKGGSSISRAVKVEVGPVDSSKFLIPGGYTIK
jgi:hypothetical protein